MSNPDEPERPQHAPPFGPPRRPGDPQQPPAPRKRHWFDVAFESSGCNRWELIE